MPGFTPIIHDTIGGALFLSVFDFFACFFSPLFHRFTDQSAFLA